MFFYTQPDRNLDGSARAESAKGDYGLLIKKPKLQGKIQESLKFGLRTSVVFCQGITSCSTVRG